jgi:hypothetical protein
MVAMAIILTGLASAGKGQLQKNLARSARLS